MNRIPALLKTDTIVRRGPSLDEWAMERIGDWLTEIGGRSVLADHP